MPASLTTDWKCVAQSGHTIDGREIKPEWLEDMAETYDTKVYKAKLWLDHMRYSSYGSVEALKSQKSGDVVKLFAKITPNRSLLQMNQVWEEYLHFSIEITEDFAKTGKTYLSGLAMTDSPASLGTDELRFSSFKGRTFTARYPGERVPDLRETDESMEKFGLKFAERFFSFLKSNTDKTETEDDMKKEDFEAFNQGLKDTNEKIETVAAMLGKFMADNSEKEPPAKEPETEDSQTEENKDEKFVKLQQDLDGLNKKFDNILTRLKKAAPGTDFNNSTEPVADDELL